MGNLGRGLEYGEIRLWCWKQVVVFGRDGGGVIIGDEVDGCVEVGEMEMVGIECVYVWQCYGNVVCEWRVLNF